MPSIDPLKDLNPLVDQIHLLNSPHLSPEVEEAMFYSDPDPEESALAESRDLRRKGWDSSASLDDNPKNSKSRFRTIGRSSTLLLEKSIKLCISKSVMI